MTDPLLTLAPRIDAAVIAAFGAEHAGIDPLLRRSDRADYQANLAMGLAKKVGAKNPREVAEKLIAHLDVADVCAKVEIAGPGFLNITLKDEFLAREADAISNDARLGVATAARPERVVIDYSSPNVAKEMHVGHIRSTVIGDAIARVLSFLQHDVVRQNHIGDWGTQFGMLIEHLKDQGEGTSALSISDLNEFYKGARAKFDSDPAFADRARQRVVALQAGDPATLDSWRLLVDQSKKYFSAIYAQLGITLTEKDVCGESFYNPRLAEVASELESRGLAVISDGALCVFPPGFAGRDGEPLPILVRKQDGGYGYGATDLAAIRYRAQDLKATRIIYVVGSPQSQHLAMVFAVGKMAGWLTEPARAEHVAFGSILGADKKMYKTRSGETVRLSALLDEAVERAAAVVGEKNADLDETARANVARMVGIGAVKYVDLSSDRIKDYVFDWDRMLAFEGNTAPYLQYAHARIRSIIRKASVDVPADTPLIVKEPAERALVMELLGFGSAVDAVATTLEPHRLCTYVFALATAYMSFHEKCPVIKAETDALRASRLRLCDLTGRVIAHGLSLLGIEAPQEM